MEGKKIVDYVVINADINEFIESNYGLKSEISKANLELLELNKELQDSQQQIKFQNLRLVSLKPFLDLEINKEQPPLQLNEMYTVNYLKLGYLRIEQDKPYVINLKIKSSLENEKIHVEGRIVNLNEKLTELNLKIKNLEVKIQALTNILNILEIETMQTPITIKMQYYASQGYVFQGGFYTREYMGYQAMVKYEE